MTYDEYKEVTLGEISIDGKGSYGIAASGVEYSEELYTYLRITDITEDGVLIKSGLKSVMDEKAENYLLKPNDIVFARTGNSTGKSYFYDGTDGPLVFAGFLIKFSLNPEKVNPKFMRFYTLSKEYKGWVTSFSTGSTRGNINALTYANMRIQLPPRKQQEFIVNILSKLEEKIEVNLNIIENLEIVSQTLFKHWFIDFEFPNEDGLPYKSSGGKLVMSELGDIPERWKIGVLEDYFKLNYGKSLTKKNRIAGDYPVYGSGGITGSHKQYLVEGPGIIVGRKGSIGTIYFEQDNFFPIDTVFYIESKGTSLNLIYSLLRMYDFTKSNNDSAVPGLNRNLVYSTKTFIADDKTIKSFELIAEPIFKKIFNLQKENKSLIELRDSLLPKLLSGEIEIQGESVVD